MDTVPAGILKVAKVYLSVLMQMSSIAALIFTVRNSFLGLVIWLPGLVPGKMCGFLRYGAYQDLPAQIKT